MSVVVQAERHIPVEFQDIYSIVKGHMSINERQQFEEVCQLIESLYAQDFMTMRRNLKHNFRPFSAGAKGQRLQQRLGKPLPPKADLDGKELHLVTDFIQLMARARFQILTKEEWEQAKQEKFKFRLPVSVDWSFFDRKLLSNFWGSTNEAKRFRMLLPDWADRCLVFKRDVMVVDDTGRFIHEKIDLLLSYVVLHPLARLWQRLRVRVRRRSTAGSNQATYVPPVAGGTLNIDRPQHANTRVVERKSLRGAMPTISAVLLGFFREYTIQEPAYREVVVLYRSAHQGLRWGKDKKHHKKKSKDERLDGILANRNINIKAFHDIPMADIETVFPEKKVYLKLLSIIHMVVSTIMLLVGVCSMLLKPGQGIDFNTLVSAGSLVCARFFQMYSAMQHERSEMVQEMTNILYDKTDDAQEGVVSMLLEDMAEQQLKEAVIAYILLYLAGQEGGASLKELDKRCEDWLEEFFGLKLDFAVEDAMPRLLEWNLVTQQKLNGETIYNAVPVAQAHERLGQRWIRAYEALGKPPKVMNYPLACLLADPNQELPPLAGSPQVSADQRLEAMKAQARDQAAAKANGAGGTVQVEKKLAPFVETENGLVAEVQVEQREQGEGGDRDGLPPVFEGGSAGSSSSSNRGSVSTKSKSKSNPLKTMFRKRRSQSEAKS